MPSKSTLKYKTASSSTRSHIVKEADQLFYKQGFDSMSFTQIADEVGIYRGNFYHHFKTKDDILEVVIAYRVDNTQMMIDAWELEDDLPVLRIRSFINILLKNQTKIKHYVFPVGTYAVDEVNKAEPSCDEWCECIVYIVSMLVASAVYSNGAKEWRRWFGDVFISLKSERSDSL